MECRHLCPLGKSFVWDNLSTGVASNAHFSVLQIFLSKLKFFKRLRCWFQNLSNNKIKRKRLRAHCWEISLQLRKYQAFPHIFVTCNSYNTFDNFYFLSSSMLDVAQTVHDLPEEWAILNLIDTNLFCRSLSLYWLFVEWYSSAYK